MEKSAILISPFERRTSVIAVEVSEGGATADHRMVLSANLGRSSWGILHDFLERMSASIRVVSEFLGWFMSGCEESVITVQLNPLRIARSKTQRFDPTSSCGPMALSKPTYPYVP